MQSKTLFVIGCLSLASAPALLAEETKPATKETKPTQKTVRLAFNWPQGLKADVTFERNKLETSSGFKHKQTVIGSYKLETAFTHRGLLIKQDQYQVRIAADNQKELNPVDQKAQDFLVSTLAQTPIFVVGRHGRVKGFFNLEQFKQELIDKGTAWSKEVYGPAKEQVHDVLQNLTSGDHIEAGLVADWNRKIALWPGQRLTQGVKHTAKGTQRFPSLGYIKAPVVLTISYLDDVPCAEDDPGKSCVKLEYSYRLDDSKFDELEKAYLTAKDDGRTALNSATLDYRLLITAEPHSMIPHEIVEYDKQTHNTSRKGYVDHPYSREITNTTRYHYTHRPKPGEPPAKKQSIE